MTALELGVCRTGRHPRLPLAGPGGGQHLLIAGTTGAGKGSWVRGVLGAAAVRPDVQIAMTDAKAMESAPWARRLASRAVEDQEIAEQAMEVMALVKMRRHIAAARGWEEWQPSVTEPVVVWLIDELAQAIEIPVFGKALSKVLHLARALGVIVVAATQQANATALGSTEMRSLFTCRAALYDSEAAGYVFTYGKDMVNEHRHVFGWLRYDRPGLAVWADGTGTPRLVRAYHWRAQHAAQVTTATAHMQRPLSQVVQWAERSLEVAA